MQDLTERQRTMLDKAQRHGKRDGYLSRSADEERQLDRLEARGLVQPNVARGALLRRRWYVTDAGIAALAAACALREEGGA